MENLTLVNLSTATADYERHVRLLAERERTAARHAEIAAFTRWQFEMRFFKSRPALKVAS